MTARALPGFDASHRTAPTSVLCFASGDGTLRDQRIDP
jgi:hypothetical protein